MSTNGHRESGKQYEAQTPEDLLERHRLDDLHEAEQRVIDTVARADELRATGHMNLKEQLTMIRHAVEYYILRLRPQLKSTRGRTDVDYWGGVTVGTMQLPDGSYKRFNGLASIIHADEYITVRWRGTDNSGFGTPDPTVQTESRQIPRDILLEAFALCNEFREAVGLDIQITSTIREAEGSYDVIDPDSWAGVNDDGD